MAPSDSAAACPELAEFICATIAQACNAKPATITPATNVLDAGMDSLTLVSVFAQVETVYGIELSTDDTLGLLEAVTIADLIERLEALRG